MSERVFAFDSQRARWIAPLLVILVGAVAYSNSFHGPFIYDDVAGLRDNPQIRSLIPFKYSSPDATAVSGRYVLIFTFAVNYAISQLHVEGYHATNLLIHLLCAWLVYAIVRRALMRSAMPATWLAAWATALWIVHPLDTGSVTYIVQRSESLGSLFLLGSIYGVIRASDGGRGWGVVAVLSCALGMASKEIVAAAPILAILYDRAFLAGSFREAWRRRRGIYLCMGATWLLILLSLHTGKREIMVGFHLGISPLDYARTELNVIAHYLRLAFWPDDLVLDYYDWPIAAHWSDISWGGWVVLGLVVATLVSLWVTPGWGFCGAWFFLILAPTSSFLPIKHEAAAEQRMYLPLAAVVVLPVVIGWAGLRRWKWALWTAGVAGCFLIVWLVRLTMARNDQYSTTLEIWTDTVAKRPNNARARVDLGLAWAEASAISPAGSADAVDAAKQAAEQFQLAMGLEPSFSKVIVLLGQSYDHMGQPLAAEDLYTRSLPDHPDIALDLLVERGVLRARREDWDGAKADFLGAIRLKPDDDEPHYYLGVVYEREGNWSGARAEFERTLAITPKYKDASERLENVKKRLGAATRSSLNGG